MSVRKWILNDSQKEILESMIDFVEENWTAFDARFEERTKRPINESVFESLSTLEPDYFAR